MHLDVLFNAGILPTSTVGEPGTHGAATTGTQGIGVSAPKAAAVAEATVGLAIELHIPKGRILTIGLLSIMLAIGMEVITRLTGNTIKVLGAAPKLHVREAPPHTTCPIHSPSITNDYLILLLIAFFSNKL
jgi:hypothetical protein